MDGERGLANPSHGSGCTQSWATLRLMGIWLFAGHEPKGGYERYEKREVVHWGHKEQREHHKTGPGAAAFLHGGLPVLVL